MFDLQEGVNPTHLSQPVVYLWMATSVPSTVLFQQEHRYSICPWSPCQEGITSENIFHSQVLRFYLSPSCSFHNCLLTTWARSGLCSRDTMANKTKLNQEYNDVTCHPTCSLTANALRPQGLHEVCSSEGQLGCQVCILLIKVVEWRRARQWLLLHSGVAVGTPCLGKQMSGQTLTPVWPGWAGFLEELASLRRKQ